MAQNETTVTVYGNLTSDPELRFTPQGTAVCNFTIASTPRTFDRQSNEFKDGTTLFMKCTAWREMGENIAASLKRGQRVVATGVLEQRNWEDKETQAKRSAVEMRVEEAGPSLRFATAAVSPTSKGQGGDGQAQGQAQAPQQQAQAPASDPFAGGDQGQAPQQNQGGFDGGF